MSSCYLTTILPVLNGILSSQIACQMDQTNVYKGNVKK